ncbi:CTP synthase [Oenococcus sicerae]|uniref:CTP synthase n=1 Tax=Oenococcus sicerae TaxID=2203724 RepID=A0AAJ1RC17_9LACO|nr:CTP synthase [Oenococcus sicerae]MDN6899982.1 CTP synthase [Oenococcus sicerae]QAS69598.1 CTP synthase [Oenococcus sicerae]
MIKTKETKYIFVTGGVVSSLGKGIVAASLGRLLKSRGLTVTVQKFDPYLNPDPGTMSPYQHGETFVTHDGVETDLDLGHYERFMDINTNKYSNVTSGKIYQEVIDRERTGDYMGHTVQVIPHVTDAIKDKIFRGAKESNADVIITEIGGTIGDIESMAFIEAIRQMKKEVGANNTFYIHVSLVPFLRAAGELKTKPTQHSVHELRGMGIQPDMIVTRSEKAITQGMKEKLSEFTDVPTDAIIQSVDSDVLYAVPLNLAVQNMDQVVLDKLGLADQPKADLSQWRALVEKIRHLSKHIKIALVGKYTDLPDAYISVHEALKHAGYAVDANVTIASVNSEELNDDNIAEKLAGMDGVIVPGGFGQRGTEGMISAIKYVRENNIPFFGVCLGMQMASVEFARDAVSLKDANSTEMDPATPYPVVGLMDSQKKITKIGGTMRLGSYVAILKAGTKTAAAYGNVSQISERHRHRYEFNNDFRAKFEKAGMVFSGTSPDNTLVEIIEYPQNDFFVAVQYHPEFLSRPERPEGLYAAFIRTALAAKDKIKH